MRRKVFYWTPNRIAELRKQKRFSQGDLAQALGVAINTVNRWERNTHVPQPNKERALDLLAVQKPLNPPDIKM